MTYRPAERRRQELRHKHRPCPCGCGELADECMTGRDPLGAFRITTSDPNPYQSRQDLPAMTELADDLKQTVTRLLQIQQTRAELEAEEKHLKTIIRTHLNVGDKGTVNGQPVIAVTPNRRFSPDLAQQKLPAELISLCSVTKIDSSAAKKALPPALYDLCMAEVGEPVVRIL